MLEPCDTVLSPRPEDKEKYLFKIIVVGDPGSGKTSFVKRYVHGMFTNNYKSTIGVDFSYKSIVWDSEVQISIQFWDLAGQERVGNQTAFYFRDARGAIILYDLLTEDTLENVKKWRLSIQEKTRMSDGSYYDPPCILLGNKKDLINDRSEKELEKEVREHAESLECVSGFAISVKTNSQIDHAMKVLIAKMLDEEKIIKEKSNNDGFSLSPEYSADSETSKNKCCFN